MSDAHRLSSFLVVASAYGDEEKFNTRMNMPVQLRAAIVSCKGKDDRAGTFHG